MKKSGKTPIIQMQGDLSGFGSLTPFVISIDAPKKADQPPERYFCRVKCSGVTDFLIDVYGVTPLQAIRLAIKMGMVNIASVIHNEEIDLSGEGGPSGFL